MTGPPKRKRGPGRGRTFDFSQYPRATNISLPGVVAKAFRRLAGNTVLPATGTPMR
jgi:hypothetical protein